MAPATKSLTPLSTPTLPGAPGRSSGRAALKPTLGACCRWGMLAGLGLALLDLSTVLRAAESGPQIAALALAILGVLLPAGALWGVTLGLLARWIRRSLWVRSLYHHLPPSLWTTLALLAFLLDTRCYRRLYTLAHAALLLLAATSLISAQRSGVKPRLSPGGRSTLFGLCAALLLLGSGQAVRERSPQVRFLTYQETTAARQVLTLISLLRPPARPAPGLRPRVLKREAAPLTAPAPAARPALLPRLNGAHVVLVTVDTLRADRLGARRASGPLMPVLEALAHRSVAFSRAYAAAPHTAFSLGSLLTGAPLRTLSELRAPLPGTLPQHLRERGYQTRAVVPQGLFFNGRHLLEPYTRDHFGFASQHFHDGNAAQATDAALELLEELRRQGEPSTFLWVHYFDPHEPYRPHAEHPFGDRPVDRYDAEVATVDAQIERLLTELQRLQRPVVLVFTADHGEEFNEHGGYNHGSSLYEEQIRVPLLLSVPGLTPRVVPRAVGLTDVAPTLLRLLDEPPLPGRGGLDLSPLLVNEALREHPVVAEVDTKRMIVQRGWKLIHDYLRDTWELYDLGADPGEHRNLYLKRSDISASLTAELYQWLDDIHHQASEPTPIGRARLGDRRALPELGTLLLDPSQALTHRIEAARLIGDLEGRSEHAALLRLLDDPTEELRAEVALSAAKLFDARAAPILRALLASRAFQQRAAMMLGRLQDPVAEPALIAVLATPTPTERRLAAFYLGIVGGEAAVAPLLALREDLHAAKDAALALGRIGARTRSPRLLPALLSWLAAEWREDVRAELCHALAIFGDRRARPDLLRVLRADPSQSWAAEALVRLGALDAEVPDAIGGLDLGRHQRWQLRGFSGCQQRDAARSEQELGGGTCALSQPRGLLRFRLRPEPGRRYLMLARVMPDRLDLREHALSLRANDAAPRLLILRPGWQELAVVMPAEQLRQGLNSVELHLVPLGGGASRPRREPWLRVDRLLLVPDR